MRLQAVHRAVPLRLREVLWSTPVAPGSAAGSTLAAPESTAGNTPAAPGVLRAVLRLPLEVSLLVVLGEVLLQREERLAQEVLRGILQEVPLLLLEGLQREVLLVVPQLAVAPQLAVVPAAAGGTGAVRGTAVQVPR